MGLRFFLCICVLERAVIATEGAGLLPSFVIFDRGVLTYLSFRMSKCRGWNWDSSLFLCFGAGGTCTLAASKEYGLLPTFAFLGRGAHFFITQGFWLLRCTGLLTAFVLWGRVLLVLWQLQKGAHIMLFS